MPQSDTIASSSQFSLEPMGQLDGFPPLGRSYFKFLTVTAHQESHFPKLAMLSCINRGWGMHDAHCEFCGCQIFQRGFYTLATQLPQYSARSFRDAKLTGSGGNFKIHREKLKLGAVTDTDGNNKFSVFHKLSPVSVRVPFQQPQVSNKSFKAPKSIW